MRTDLERFGAEGGTRTPTSYLTRPSNVRVYQFRHFGLFGKDVKNLCAVSAEDFGVSASGVNERNHSQQDRRTAQCGQIVIGYFFVGAAVALGDAAGVGAGVAVGAGVGVACAGVSGTPPLKTEPGPVIAGSERSMAISMNAIAEPIVIFESNVCVPRGPKAVLDTELEKSAPASALPGCNKIVTTRMMHARINSP